MDFLFIPAYDNLLKQIVWSNRVLGRPKMEPAINRSGEKLTLLTAHEAAKYLRVSLSTLNRIERRGLLSPLRTPGGHRRYTLAMLNECLAQHTADTEVD
jgi:excisionase family DNA binding protein